ncbi:hypothetical protein [Spiroplasma culicicola]|uniref:Uncharacterized protein n=1 Tax=Spiroplasma culicicola AES-1 TaxID=1276246 RepID=W6A856_9MOLU|nr:hypothetical protein [Spiroplasma culicicola]AHI53323.1 hypothetical protein SCULI_v1c09830 [Spiroplasma culicicola AES-1]
MKLKYILVSLGVTDIIAVSLATPIMIVQGSRHSFTINTFDEKLLTDRKWKVDEVFTKNTSNTDSIFNTVTKIIYENYDIKPNEPKIDIYLGRQTLDTISKENNINNISKNFFVKEFTVVLGYQNIVRLINVDTKINILDTPNIKYYPVNTNKVRPADMSLVQLFDFYIDSLNDTFNDSINLEILNEWLIKINRISEGNKLFSSPFEGITIDPVFVEEEYISYNYYEAGLEFNNVPETNPIMQLGLIPNSDHYSANVEFYVYIKESTVSALHKQTFGKTLKDKAEGNKESFINISYNDDSTLGSLRNDIETVVANWFAFMHGGWYFSKDDFKFKFIKSYNDPNGVWSEATKLSQLWGYSSGAPYITIYIDQIINKNIELEKKNTSFILDFVKGGWNNE